MVSSAQRKKIKQLRAEGLGYMKIADAVGLSKDSVRSVCRALEKDYAPVKETKPGGACLECGKPMHISSTGRPKKFCSDQCRFQYWNKHRGDLKKNPAAVYTKTCLYCGRSFEVYGHREAKYCCHEHAIRDRFGDKNHQ